MGLRGPQRTPGSRRWKLEQKKKAQELGVRYTPPETEFLKQVQPDLPAYPPVGLSDRLTRKWLALVADMTAAGIQVKQVDAQCIALAVRYMETMERYDELCARTDLEPEVLISALRSRQSAMKEYLTALEKIGGTPLVRMRAKIAPEEKLVKATDDPWGSL